VKRYLKVKTKDVVGFGIYGGIPSLLNGKIINITNNI
jgi:hypothetical protein